MQMASRSSVDQGHVVVLIAVGPEQVLRCVWMKAETRAQLQNPHSKPRRSITGNTNLEAFSAQKVHCSPRPDPGFIYSGMPWNTGHFGILQRSTWVESPPQNEVVHSNVDIFFGGLFFLPWQDAKIFAKCHGLIFTTCQVWAGWCYFNSQNSDIQPRKTFSRPHIYANTNRVTYFIPWNNGGTVFAYIYIYVYKITSPLFIYSRVLSR